MEVSPISPHHFLSHMRLSTNNGECTLLSQYRADEYMGSLGGVHKMPWRCYAVDMSWQLCPQPPVDLDKESPPNLGSWGVLEAQEEMEPTGTRPEENWHSEAYQISRDTLAQGQTQRPSYSSWIPGLSYSPCSIIGECRIMENIVGIRNSVNFF